MAPIKVFGLLKRAIPRQRFEEIENEMRVHRCMSTYVLYCLVEQRDMDISLAFDHIHYCLADKNSAKRKTRVLRQLALFDGTLVPIKYSTKPILICRGAKLVE